MKQLFKGMEEKPVWGQIISIIFIFLSLMDFAGEG
jgi:hypothetical protein